MKQKTAQRQTREPGGIQFLVNLRNQQHNSWQGSIQRLDTGETINFRSALELMVLMESVAGEQIVDGEERRERLRTWSKNKEVEGPDSQTQTG